MSRIKVLLTTNILHKEYGEPIGILFLAAYLRQNGIVVDVYDPEIYGDNDLNTLLSICNKNQYQFIGISVLTSSDESITTVANMAKTIHKELPYSIIGCGGIGASLRYQDFIKVEFVDLVVIGEGENTVLEIVSMIRNNDMKSLENIHGVVTKHNLYYTKRTLISNLDSLPFMARDTLDERIKELSSQMVSQFELRIFCGRGCFGSCTFCANIAARKMCNGNSYRQRSIENLTMEMELLHNKYGVSRFSFWDDNFIPRGDAGYKKIKEIYDMVKKLSFVPILGIQTRVDTVNDEKIKILQAAGVQNVYLGVENIDVDELNILGKHVSPQQIRDALTVLYKYGYSYNSESKYRLRIGYIAFNPYTTINAVRRNFDFMDKFNIPINKLNKKLLAFHGTRIRERIENDNLLKDGFDWKFVHSGVEQLYLSINTIVNLYLTYYDKIRFISKIAKFGRLKINWDEVDVIKKELHCVTKRAIKNICYTAEKDDSKATNMDDVIVHSIKELNQVAIKFSIEENYVDFIKRNASIVEKFHRVAYVFFD